jgi:hypothetical protein
MEVKDLEAVEQTVEIQEITEMDVSMLAKVAGGIGAPMVS